MNTSTFHTTRWLAVAWLLALIPAAPAALLDAHWDGPGDGSGGPLGNLGIDISQTFTIEHAGTLSAVQFQVFRSADFTGVLNVDIRPVVAGVPNAFAASALFSTTVAASQIGINTLTNVTVDVSPGNIGVLPGDMLALTLSSDAPVGGVRWVYTTVDPYAGGHGYFRGNTDGVAFMLGGADQVFETFVETAPEPGSLVLGGSGLLLAAIARRKTRKR
jgi:hypothetical protein